MATPIKIPCTVAAVIEHDAAVSTVTLRPARRLPNFKPGQFLHLALDPFDPTIGFWPESRVFSIASLATDPEVSIAYSVKGPFTRRMRQELSAGKEVWIRLPYGHFSMAAGVHETVLVAGGTGITPFIAFILNELKRPSGAVLSLVYGVRKPELLLFTDILQRAASQLAGFKLLAFSEEIDTVTAPFHLRPGSLSFDELWAAARDPQAATFYLAGPAAMISTFRAGLGEKGVDPANIKIDEWE